MTQLLPPHPAPGEIVRVRQRQYLVEDVQPPPEPGEATLVSMSCLDDDAQGEALEVLWEHEIDTEVVRASWDRLGRRDFDAPSRFAAYLHALRWNCVTATNPRLFQSPWRAGIEVMAYQLEPLRKALRLPRVNIFIADDVGLGKTIEAGLVLREMLMRQRVRRAVVVAPPSVVVQWREELERRFGLTFVIYDREYVARCRRERGYAVNPWTTHSRFILSHALLRDEEYAAPLRDLLGVDEKGNRRDGADPGSLLILDEAHHAAPASSSKYAIDSQFTRAVRSLAERFEHRLFLSATPHNGLSNSFSALLEILDPQRFVRGTGAPAECEAIRAAIHGGRRHSARTVEFYPTWFEGDAPWIVTSPEQSETLRLLETKFAPIEHGGLAHVGIGVATGCDHVFIVGKDTDIESERLLPLVMRDDIERGLIRDAGRFVINTFRDEGGLVDLHDYPKLARYLKTHAPAIRKRHVAKKAPASWFRTIDRVYPKLVGTPKLLIPDIAGANEVVFDKGRFHPHHNLYFVTSDHWDLEVLGGLLSSRVALFFVWSYAVKMRGGYLRFQAQYLRRIRLPAPENLPAPLGAKIKKAFRTRDFAALDNLSLQAYGLAELPAFDFVDTRGR